MALVRAGTKSSPARFAKHFSLPGVVVFGIDHSIGWDRQHVTKKEIRMNQDSISKNEQKVRAHVWVKGRVQGVGFRAHVEYSARQMSGLTGWVRNVGYDTVEAM